MELAITKDAKTLATVKNCLRDPVQTRIVEGGGSLNLARGFIASQIEFHREPTDEEKEQLLECFSFTGGYYKLPGQDWQVDETHGRPCHSMPHPDRKPVEFTRDKQLSERYVICGSCVLGGLEAHVLLDGVLMGVVVFAQSGEEGCILRYRYDTDGADVHTYTRELLTGRVEIFEQRPVR